MEYSKLISVTGLPGLQELISSKNDGAIVRSLDDKTTKFISSRMHNFSHLESIEIYTQQGNVNLVEIFHAMEKTKTSLPDEKDPKAVKGYFEKVYPEMDFERVYNSDMKKLIRWFSVLKANNIEIKLTEIPEEPVEEPAPPAPKKEKAEKKAPAKEKSTTKEKEVAEVKPAKKKEAEKPAKKTEKAPAKKTASKKK